MTTLIVALPLTRPAAGTEFVYALTDDGRSLRSHGSASLGLLPAAASLVLVLPAKGLSWHTVKLPPVPAHRLRAALDGAMEERVLDEPASLALSVSSSRTADGELLVAACDKLWLRSMLEFFEAGQRPANRVVPEFAPLAAEVSQRVVVVTGTAEEPGLVVITARHVLCAPFNTAAAVLGPLPLDAEQAQVFAEPPVAELAEQVLARPATILPLGQAMLDSARGTWELAQFDLALSSGGRLARRFGQRWQAFARAASWRPARWGLALLLLANLVGLNAWAWQQSDAVQARREQVRGLLSKTFPNVRTVVDAPLQMEREVARLRQASGALSGRDMEVMLAAVGAALPPGRMATGIDYAPGELSLKGLAMDAAQASSLTARLAGESYVARMDGDRLIVRAGATP